MFSFADCFLTFFCGLVWTAVRLFQLAMDCQSSGIYLLYMLSRFHVSSVSDLFLELSQAHDRLMRPLDFQYGVSVAGGGIPLGEKTAVMLRCRVFHFTSSCE